MLLKRQKFSRRAALGLLCRCRSASNFRPTCVKGFLKVNVSGYHPGGLYTVKQIEDARAGFQSVEMLDFVKQLAFMTCMNFQRSVHWIKNLATVLAYQRAVFKEHNGTCTDALGAQPSFPSNSKMVLAKQEKNFKLRTLMGHKWGPLKHNLHSLSVQKWFWLSRLKYHLEV